MIESAIRLVLTNIPVLLFVAALIIAARDRSDPIVSRRYLSWLLLWVGVQALWGGVFHVFAPDTAAAFIHWEPSPFQFEIGIADISLGIVAVASFWRPLEFKAAVVFFVTLFHGGLAVGHIREIVSSGNDAPGNAGLLLVLTIISVVLLPALYVLARRHAPHPDA